jgi:hypothetical protein
MSNETPTSHTGYEPYGLLRGGQQCLSRWNSQNLRDLGLIKPQYAQHPPMRGWQANDTFQSVFRPTELDITQQLVGF